LETGTPVLLPNGEEIPVDDLRSGMEVASLDLPGLMPETPAAEYRKYSAVSIDGAKKVRTRVAHIVKDCAELMMEIKIAGRERPLRVTPSHPLFVYDATDCQYRFVQAGNLDMAWHRLLNYEGVLTLIESMDLYEGEFTIFKVDCSPLDVFYHNGVLGHNMKIGGNSFTYQSTSQATTTSWTSSWTTSVTTSAATTTSWNSSRTTSVTTSVSTSVSTTA